jgi:Icc protein
MMKIVQFELAPIYEFRFLNAGRGSGDFYEDQLPVHHARVERLPEGLQALVVTADLQGRETFEDSGGGPLRLLGEVLPQRLVDEVLPELGLDDPQQVAALLAGDFYTVPALDKRGGTGDVSGVWNAFRQWFAWVAGVAGNHDLFGDQKKVQPDRFDRMHFLEGDIAEVDGLRIAGLGGIIGNPSRPQRRTEEDYFRTLSSLLRGQPDILLMHDGPDGSENAQPGNSMMRNLLQEEPPGLVIRGHSHWANPFAEFPCGLQVLNVDARVVILTE